MHNEVVTIYCIVDDILKALNVKDDPQAKMSSSEILATAIVACLFFGGNLRKALNAMSLFFSYVLSEGRFLKRLYKLSEKLDTIFESIVILCKALLSENIESYAIDTFLLKFVRM